MNSQEVPSKPTHHEGALKLLFDSCSLITASKFKLQDRLVLDYILKISEIHIPEEVRNETTRLRDKYADAREIEKRINRGDIKVHKVKSQQKFEAELEHYKIDPGEKEAILLYLYENSFDFLIVDDHLAFIVCNRFGVKARFFLDLIVHFTNMGMLERDTAFGIIEAVRTRYAEGFVTHSISMINRGDTK